MESRIDPSSDNEARSIDERLDKLAEDIKKLPPDRIEALERLVGQMSKKAVSISEAAVLLGVSIDTIRRAIKSGSVKAFQITARGNYRIPIEEIERFMN